MTTETSEFHIPQKNVHIIAGGSLSVSDNLGENVNINVSGDFLMGQHGYIGPGTRIRGNNVTIGDHFYCSGDLEIGGGGSGGKDADLWIGDRCTMHKGFINLCEPVYIGNDVGFSHGVSLITHGFWMSVLEGYPRKFSGIRIYDKVILGYGATVLPGCSIDEGAVIGAGSVVTKPLGKGIWGGNPAKFIKDVKEPTEKEKRFMFGEITARCGRLGLTGGCEYPTIKIDYFTVNVLTGEWEGQESENSDKLRDILRKFGIRIYTERGFG